MALVVKDRVKVQTATTGTGTLTLGSAVAKFQDFSVVGDGNTTYYAIESGNGTDWEVGVGTYTASGTTLSRDTILESSNAGSAISLSGTSTVFCTYPAERSVNTEDIGSTVQAYDADTTKNDVANTFTANQTINADLTVDTNTLYVDSTNNLVGIGTTTPTQKVEIVGSLATTYSNTTLPTSGGGSVIFIDNTDTSTSSTSSILFKGTDAGGTFRHGAAITWGKSGAWTDGGSNYGSYLSFYTRVDGGTALERMRIDSSGNVGIGTSSPSSKLSIVAATGNGLNVTTSSSNAADAIIVTATNSSLVNLTSVGRPSDNASKIRFVNSAFSAETAAITELGGGGNLAINTAGTERMRITSAGNVGIGTSSPSKKLEVAGNIRASSSGSTEFDLSTSAANTTAHIFSALSASGFDFANLIVGSNTTRFNISGSERMRIDSTGRVGIGNSSPAVLLDVLGDGLIQRLRSTTSISAYLRFDGTGTSFPYVGLLNGIGTFGNTDASPIRFMTNSLERMRIDSTGKVGIGTSSPDALLTVNTIASFGAGAASAPSIAAKGDLDTGMYFPGANQVALSTAGNVRLNISSSGTMIASKYNGTAASPSESADWPTPILALRGYGDFTQESMLSFGYSNDAAYQTGSNVWGFRLNGVASATTSSSSTHLNLVGPGQFYLYSGGDAIFAPGGSERMRIVSGGNVGIGTSSPTQKLDVNGTVKATTFSGDGSALTGVGKVLQVVQTVKTDVYTSTTANSWGDVTGLSCTITPSSTSSKILALVHVNGGGTPGQVAARMRFLRGATVIYQGDASGTRTRGIGQNSGGDLAFNGTAIVMYLDSPATTSATTYKIQRHAENTNLFCVNRTIRDADGNDCRSASSITLMEIAG